MKTNFAICTEICPSFILPFTPRIRLNRPILTERRNPRARRGIPRFQGILLARLGQSGVHGIHTHCARGDDVAQKKRSHSIEGRRRRGTRDRKVRHLAGGLTNLTPTRRPAHTVRQPVFRPLRINRNSLQPVSLESVASFNAAAQRASRCLGGANLYRPSPKSGEKIPLLAFLRRNSSLSRENREFECVEL